MTKAEVVVFSHFREERSGRYLIRLSKLAESYPTDNEVTNCTIVNRAVEEAIIKDPAQYWWVHRRFKTRPPGVARPY
jgi:KDO2-lipid IV(A) lauroyltransferase